MHDTPANIRHRLVLVRDLERSGADDRGLRRLAESGALVRVRRGCYLPSDEWKALDSSGRHLARAHAVAANAAVEPVFSHFTAAALHGVPVIGALPVNVHVTIERGARRRRQPDLTVHSLDLQPHEISRVDGLLVTTLTRTLIDLALTTAFSSATASLDWALAHGVARSDLQGELERMNPARRGLAASKVIDFADPAIGSPGESVSRAGMFLLGFPAPDLQVPIVDPAGLIGITDFYWPDIRLIGEFDGQGKYLRTEMTAGQTAGEVVMVEKQRENRMRATDRSMVRWDWPVATDLVLLGKRLSAAGLTTSR